MIQEFDLVAEVSVRIRGQVPPDVVVIGAMRAGTTTLYEMMRATKTVSMARMKETDFFLGRQFERGLKWLNAQYDDLEKPIIDMSPNYAKVYRFPEVAERIYQTNPDAKLVYVVRDPIKRAKSEFRHLTAMGYDQKLPHETAPRIGACVGDGSLYYDQIQAYLKFFPLEQIEIIEFEDLIEDQWGTLLKLYDRLGLPQFGDMDQEIHTNSSEELERVPHWWGQMRNEPAIEWLRSKTPRTVIAMTKSVVFKGQGNRAKDVEFPEEAVLTLKKTLAEDAAKFRDLTGRSFERWSI